MKTIEERARLAAWQIFEEIGLSQHSVDRVSEIIAEKLLEQKRIDIENACKWFGEYLMDIGYPDDWCRDSKVLMSGEERFRKAMLIRCESDLYDVVIKKIEREIKAGYFNE